MDSTNTPACVSCNDCSQIYRELSSGLGMDIKVLYCDDHMGTVLPSQDVQPPPLRPAPSNSDDVPSSSIQQQPPAMPHLYLQRPSFIQRPSVVQQLTDNNANGSTRNDRIIRPSGGRSAFDIETLISQYEEVKRRWKSGKYKNLEAAYRSVGLTKNKFYKRKRSFYKRVLPEYRQSTARVHQDII